MKHKGRVLVSSQELGHLKADGLQKISSSQIYIYI